MTIEQRRVVQRGEATYRELCFSCHGGDGKGAPMAGAAPGVTLAPPLSGSARVLGHRDYVINVLLQGLSGPVADKEYPGGIMVPMGMNTDQWIADVASYVRNSFGNSGVFVTPEDVARVRAATARKSPWTLAELERAIPALLTNTAQWKVTASHNPDAASNVLAGTTRWDSAAPQQPGMWFQIELPEPTSITELVIDSMVPGAFGRGRGGGGRGAGPAVAPVGFTVQVSDDGSAWGAPIAQGAGTTPSTTISFPPVRARFVRITQTGTARTNEMWAVQQIKIYRAGVPPR